MKRLLRKPTVRVGVTSGCSVGLRHPISGILLSKRWKFVTSSPEIANQLSLPCQGGHAHVRTEGGSPLPGLGVSLPRWTQVYPIKLIKRILQGISKASVIQDGGEEVEACAVDDDDDGGGGEACPRRPQSFGAALRRLHVNLGHATTATMLRHLRHANASPEAIRQAANFHCDDCESRRQPGIARFSAPPTPTSLEICGHGCEGAPLLHTRGAAEVSQYRV